MVIARKKSDRVNILPEFKKFCNKKQLNDFIKISECFLIKRIRWLSFNTIRQPFDPFQKTSSTSLPLNFYMRARVQTTLDYGKGSI